MKHARPPAGRHRPEAPGRHRPDDPGRHRGHVRPRYGRIAVLACAVAVTGVAVLGGLGVLPRGTDPQLAAASADEASVAALVSSRDATHDPAEDRDRTGSRSQGEDRSARRTPTVALPDDSGSGRRAVFSESEQRVWIVGGQELVKRTYLVSGSIYDNLDPGTYEVYSRSRYAVGIDDSGTMEYFVRFTQGDEGAAIGFHSIPVDDGAPIQTTDELGTPLSHGCIRQDEPDAIAMWEFARMGTTVVVTP